MTHGAWLKALLAGAKDVVASCGKSPVLYDVGARDGISVVWDTLARLGLVRAVGFEPDPEEYDLLSARDPHVKYLMSALWNVAGIRNFYVTRMPGCSSFREPNYALLKQFPASAIFDPVKVIDLPVERMDMLITNHGLPAPDFLKIDTQGAEMEVLEGCGAYLDHVIGLELEAQFKPMYKDQALFPEIKAFLDDRGFILRNLKVNGPYEGEMLEVDAFFSRRPALNEGLPMLRLWQLATDIASPQFLAQMNGWKDEWLVNLTSDQITLCERLFGSCGLGENGSEQPFSTPVFGAR